MSLDLSNFITVSLTSTPKGLIAPNVNTIAFFTTDKPKYSDSYRTYISPRQVALDFGSNTDTANFANTIFSQSPSLLAGKGALVIIPLINAISATAAILTSADITSNLAAIKELTDGSLTLNINGKSVTKNNINFTNIVTIKDVAKVLQESFPSISIIKTTTGFIMTGKTFGEASVITAGTFSGTGTDISVAAFLNLSAAISEDGIDSSGEKLVDAIIRTEELVGYVGIITNLKMSTVDFIATSDLIQSRDKMYYEAFSSEDDIDIGTQIVSKGNTKTRLLLYLDNVSGANSFKAGYASKISSANFNGSNTALTMNLKSLETVFPDTLMTDSIKMRASAAGFDVYSGVRSNTNNISVVACSGANDFSDNIINKIWIKGIVEIGAFNYMRQTNTKIPQTQQAANGMASAIAVKLEQGKNNGIIAIGLPWNSPDIFGDEIDFKRNILEIGYYIYSLPLAQQDQSEREQRILPLIQIAIKFTSAVHKADVTINIEY